MLGVNKPIKGFRGEVTATANYTFNVNAVERKTGVAKTIGEIKYNKEDKIIYFMNTDNRIISRWIVEGDKLDDPVICERAIGEGLMFHIQNEYRMKKVRFNYSEANSGRSFIERIRSKNTCYGICN